jgi:hypothetical protein
MCGVPGHNHQHNAGVYRNGLYQSYTSRHTKLLLLLLLLLQVPDPDDGAQFHHAHYSAP